MKKFIVPLGYLVFILSCDSLEKDRTIHIYNLSETGVDSIKLKFEPNALVVKEKNIPQNGMRKIITNNFKITEGAINITAYIGGDSLDGGCCYYTNGRQLGQNIDVKVFKDTITTFESEFDAY